MNKKEWKIRQKKGIKRAMMHHHEKYKGGTLKYESDNKIKYAMLLGLNKGVDPLLSQVTMSDIARFTGVNRKTLYNHLHRFINSGRIWPMTKGTRIVIADEAVVGRQLTRNERLKIAKRQLEYGIL